MELCHYLPAMDLPLHLSKLSHRVSTFLGFDSYCTRSDISHFGSLSFPSSAVILPSVIKETVNSLGFPKSSSSAIRCRSIPLPVTRSQQWAGIRPFFCPPNQQESATIENRPGGGQGTGDKENCSAIQAELEVLANLEVLPETHSC